GEEAGFLRQLRDLDAGGAERATRHRQRDRLVAGIERDLVDRGCFGHLMHSSWPALPGTGWMESAACRDAAIIAQRRRALDPPPATRAIVHSVPARPGPSRKTAPGNDDGRTVAAVGARIRGASRVLPTSRSACGTCPRGR